jgi:hypothetical protein
MPPLPAGHPQREEIVRLERQRADAMVRKDLAALSTLLAEDLSYTHSDGRRDTKQSFLALIRGQSLQYVGIDYSDQEVIDCSGAVAVRGVARMRLVRDPEGRQDYKVLFLDVWVRRDGRWQTLAWHATRAPQ